METRFEILSDTQVHITTESGVILHTVEDAKLFIDEMFGSGSYDNYFNQLKVENEYQRYVQRKIDGEEYHLRICAELRVVKLGGGMTQEQYDAIYAATAPARNEIVAGQWLSGLKEFEKLNGALSEGLYSRIHTDITNYIQLHYA